MHPDRGKASGFVQLQPVIINIFSGFCQIATGRKTPSTVSVSRPMASCCSVFYDTRIASHFILSYFSDNTNLFFHFLQKKKRTTASPLQSSFFPNSVIVYVVSLYFISRIICPTVVPDIFTVAAGPKVLNTNVPF